MTRAGVPPPAGGAGAMADAFLNLGSDGDAADSEDTGAETPKTKIQRGPEAQSFVFFWGGCRCRRSSR